MRIRVAATHEAERCVYCHDALERSRAVCRSCGATYHVECGERCATLGCAGKLERKVRGRLLEATVFELIAASLVVGPLLLLLLLVPGVPRVVPLVGLVGIGVCLANLAAEELAAIARSQRPRAATRSAAAPGSTAPASAPAAPAPAEPVGTGSIEDRLPLPFASAPPEPAGSQPDEDSSEERRRHLEALQRRRPPGLGRTL